MDCYTCDPITCTDRLLILLAQHLFTDYFSGKNILIFFLGNCPSSCSLSPSGAALLSSSSVGNDLSLPPQLQ